MTGHPTLPVAYLASRNPAEPHDNLEPTGHLHVTRATGHLLGLEVTHTLPARGSQAAIAPDGSFLVVDAPRPELGSSGYPEVREYVLQTVTLGSDGVPTDSAIATASAAGVVAAG